MFGVMSIASAGVVSQNDFVQAALVNTSPGQRALQQQSHIEVLLDLSGYRDAAVSFDFATLMGGNAGFVVSSAAATTFRNDFRLVSPIRARFTQAANGRFSRGGNGGFTWGRSNRRYETAMFNLAAYDGQTVLLALDFNAPTASRRGFINIDNLSVTVSEADSNPAAAVVPEPGTGVLMLAAAFGFLLHPASRRKARALV